MVAIDKAQAKKFGLIADQPKPAAPTAPTQTTTLAPTESNEIKALQAQVGQLAYTVETLSTKRLDVVATVERDKAGKMTAIRIQGQ